KVVVFVKLKMRLLRTFVRVYPSPDWYPRPFWNVLNRSPSETKSTFAKYVTKSEPPDTLALVLCDSAWSLNSSFSQSTFGYRSLSSFVADRKSTRLNSSHVKISYAVFCLKKKNQYTR